MDNATKFFQDFCGQAFQTVETLQHVQAAFRTHSFSEKTLELLDTAFNTINSGFLTKLQELEQAPLGITFGKKAEQLGGQQS